MQDMITTRERREHHMTDFLIALNIIIFLVLYTLLVFLLGFAVGVLIEGE